MIIILAIDMVEYKRSGSGPFLICIPGLDGTGRLFTRQLESLCSHHTVITFPLRNDAAFTYADLEDDVLEILEQEHVEKATIVGESFGGTVALHFALDHPEKIEQLVLVNTFPYFRRRKLLWLAKVLLPFAFVPVIRTGRNIIIKPVLLNEMVDEKGIEILLKYSWSHTYPAYRQRLKLISSHDVRKRLSNIQVPVTIVAAGRDKIIPSVKEAKFMADQIPNARIHVLPEHGHSCLLSASFDLDALLSNNLSK